MKKKLLIIPIIVILLLILGLYYFKTSSETTANSLKKKELKEKINSTTKKDRKNVNEDEKINIDSEETDLSDLNEETISKSNQDNKNATNISTDDNVSSSSTYIAIDTNNNNDIPISSEKNPWELLGISEKEYYTTPLFPEEELNFDTDSKCIEETIRIGTTYHFRADYGDTTGKYVNKIGCYVIVYINGRDTLYSEFKQREENGEFSPIN